MCEFYPRDSEVCLHIADCAFTPGRMNGKDAQCGRWNKINLRLIPISCSYVFACLSPLTWERFRYCIAHTITAQVCRESEKASFPWTSWWANIFQCILQILVKTLVKTCFGQIHMLVKTRVILFPPISPPCNLLFNSLVTRCRVPGTGPFEMHTVWQTR